MINYVTGDATQPQSEGNKLIIHVSNDIGAWGAGFVMALSKRWKEPERYYHSWFNPKRQFLMFVDDSRSVGGCQTSTLSPKLGSVQTVWVDDGLYVINMIGQRGVISRENPIPLDYQALEKCLDMVAHEARRLTASVHGPRFGAGLAGGDWNKIEAMIQKCLVDKGVPVTIYDWQG